MRRCQEVIHRVAGNLIQEKKRKIAEAEAEGKTYQGKDLLSLLRTLLCHLSLLAMMFIATQ